MSAIRAYEQLMEALNALRRQWRQRQLLVGVLLAAAVTLAALFAVALADNLVKGGGVVRLGPLGGRVGIHRPVRGVGPGEHRSREPRVHGGERRRPGPGPRGREGRGEGR